MVVNRPFLNFLALVIKSISYFKFIFINTHQKRFLFSIIIKNELKNRYNYPYKKIKSFRGAIFHIS